MASTTSSSALLDLIKQGKPMTMKQQLLLTAQLSAPAIMAQLSSIVMQYIDASMVGSLGAHPAASIGLVSTTIWLFAGICSASTTGFAVQVAHMIGASRNDDARSVVRQSLVACLLFGCFMSALGCAISGPLPRWLGGSDIINADATRYFLVFALCIPFLVVRILAGAMLRCSGNMKVPGLLNVLACVLDVIFNFFLIFPTRDISCCGMVVTMPGAGLAVTGAVLGTAFAEVITAGLMLYFLYFRSTELQMMKHRGSFAPTRPCLNKAVRISLPMAIQHTVMCTAQIFITAIVAPLGSVAIAANSFAITAESLCYMPGYGISEAATTLVGQSIGARRRDLTRRFAAITVGAGMAIMTVMGVLMYVAAPLMMGIMTPVQQVVDLGTQVLRIEAWAEPLFAAAIVSYGVFVGAGDTKVPAIMNFSSMWGVRLILAALLAPTMGLRGVWMAMCIELCVRGALFLLRLRGEAWTRKKTVL